MSAISGSHERNRSSGGRGLSSRDHLPSEVEVDVTCRAAHVENGVDVSEQNVFEQNVFEHEHHHKPQTHKHNKQCMAMPNLKSD